MENSQAEKKRTRRRGERERERERERGRARELSFLSVLLFLPSLRQRQPNDVIVSEKITTYNIQILVNEHNCILHYAIRNKMYCYVKFELLTTQI